MTLKNWLKENKISHEKMGRLLDCTMQTVRTMCITNKCTKLNMAKKIARITNGNVSLEDWI